MELLTGLYPTEAVQKGRPPQEVVLRFTRRGCGEFEGTHVVELCLGGSRTDHEEACDQQKRGSTGHQSLLMGKGQTRSSKALTEKLNIAPMM